MEHLSLLREKTAKLPLSPGVYLMKDAKGKIIYVGKAKQLRNRVSNYFAATHRHDRKTAKLVERIRDFDYIVVPKEIDAFVLETTLIKQHQPKYNILLKDDKGFHYIKITRGAFPRVQYVLDSSDPNADYIGPYVSGFFVKQSVEDVNRIFLLPSCNRRLSGTPDPKHRPCLNYRIKRCMGACTGNISQEEYAGIIKSALDYIKGGSKAGIAALTEEMNAAAENLDFELAARLRDRINAMVRVFERGTVQSVISTKLTDYDVVALVVEAEQAAAAVVRYSKGRLIGKECFYLGDEYDPAKMLEDFLIGYYGSERLGSDNDDGAAVPREIYIEQDTEDTELLAEYLSSVAKNKVKLHIPKRGEGLAQMMLAKNNAIEFLTLKVGRKTRETAVLEELSQLLGLSVTPKLIECYDISNIGEGIKVGGMVTYKDGKPFKKGYRKFTIKEVAGLDDYACMRETVHRRFSLDLSEHVAEEYGDTDKLGRKYPDLIFVDGGQGHVSAAQSVLDELKLQIPLFGLVKDTKHRTRAVASAGGEIQINANKNVFAFLTKVQDEVHRFSVTFAREKHRKATFALSLTKVPGIGEAKAAALLKRFKTKSALRAATVEELMEAAKINHEKATVLKAFIESDV